MKKYLVFSAVAALISCSKGSELEIVHATNGGASDVLANLSGSAKIGEYGPNGPTITYDMEDLEEITSCAMAEDTTTGLEIVQYYGQYGLQGIASSEGSFTTFNVRLVAEDGELFWAEDALVFTCSNGGEAPCEVVLTGSDSFECDSENEVCVDEVFYGMNASTGPPCQWPWLVSKGVK